MPGLSGPRASLNPRCTLCLFCIQQTQRVSKTSDHVTALLKATQPPSPPNPRCSLRGTFQILQDANTPPPPGLLPPQRPVLWSPTPALPGSPGSAITDDSKVLAAPLGAEMVVVGPHAFSPFPPALAKASLRAHTTLGSAPGWRRETRHTSAPGRGFPRALVVCVASVPLPDPRTMLPGGTGLQALILSPRGEAGEPTPSLFTVQPTQAAWAWTFSTAALQLTSHALVHVNLGASVPPPEVFAASPWVGGSGGAGRDGI